MPQRTFVKDAATRKDLNKEKIARTSPRFSFLKKVLTNLSICDRLCLSTNDRQEENAMEEIKLGMVEARFADIVWQKAPISTKELVASCEKELNWKRTTTYTVLKKLCDKGIFKTENSIVTVLISKEEFYAIQSEKFVDDAFGGSLPAFIAAFASRKKLSERELEKIRDMLELFDEE